MSSSDVVRSARLEGDDNSKLPPPSSTATETGVEAKKSKMESSSSDHKEVKSRDRGRHHRSGDSSRHHKSSHKSSNTGSSSRHKKESSSRRDRDRDRDRHGRRSRSRDKHSSSKRGHDSKKSSRRDSSSSSSSSSSSASSRSSSSSSSSSRRHHHRDDRRDSDRRKQQSSRHRRSSSRDRHKHSRHDSHKPRDSRGAVTAPRSEEKPQRDTNAAANARSIADRLNAAIKANSPGESSASVSTSDLLKTVQVPKAIISDPVEAAKYQMEQLRKKAEELTGVKVPSFYSSNAINPLVYAEQQRKRKLLWSKAKDNENTSTQIVGKAIVEGQDEKTAEKFRKLMGLKNSSADAATGSHDSASNSPSSSAAVDQIQRMQKQAFDALDKEYAFARMATHTHRGMGLGFATQGFSSSTQPAPK